MYGIKIDEDGEETHNMPVGSYGIQLCSSYKRVRLMFNSVKICAKACIIGVSILLHSASFIGKVKIVMLIERLTLSDQVPM